MKSIGINICLVITLIVISFRSLFACKSPGSSEMLTEMPLGIRVMGSLVYCPGELIEFSTSYTGDYILIKKSSDLNQIKREIIY